MLWYKHETDLHTQRFMSDAIAEHGLRAYAFYCILFEIYGKDYNDTNDQRELEISFKYIRYKTRINRKHIKLLLKYFSETAGKITYREEEQKIFIRINDFIKIASNWTIRRERETGELPHEGPQAQEEEKEEEENKEENLITTAKTIIQYLNIRTGKNYRDIKPIVEMLRKGWAEDDFIQVIDNKTKSKFFRENKRLFQPKYLFKEENFEMYMNEDENEDGF